MFVDPEGAATAAFEQVIGIAVGMDVDFNPKAVVTYRTLHDILLSLILSITL